MGFDQTAAQQSNEKARQQRKSQPSAANRVSMSSAELDQRKIVKEETKPSNYGVGFQATEAQLKKLEEVKNDSPRNYAHNTKIMEQIEQGKGEIAERWKKAADEEGHIIKQNYLSDFKYGAQSSNDNGCGWIAAYNALLDLGERVSPQNVIYDIEDHMVLRGMLGSDFDGISSYFEKKGYKVEKIKRVPSKDSLKISEMAQSGDACIMFYYRDEPFEPAHFIAFSPTGKNKKGENTFKFYNTYLREDVETLEQLQSKDPAFYKNIIIIKKKNAP